MELRERWTEADVKALPAGEHDYFERKAGQLYSEPHFADKLAKTLSAIANSGGGHILIGVKDDGTFDGVDPGGRTTSRDRIEQIIPNLVDYQLSKFRVHEVEPSSPSDIPAGKVVIVIDVGDSPHAPHQARYDRTYYYRPGGRSDVAPHFYLEALRNRRVGPVLMARPVWLQNMRAHWYADGLFLQVVLAFNVSNSGRTMAKEWTLLLECSKPDLLESQVVRFDDVPSGGAHFILSTIAETNSARLLPTLATTSLVFFGLALKTADRSREAIAKALDDLFDAGLGLSYSVVSEHSRGESQPLDDSQLRSWLTTDLIHWVLPATIGESSHYGGFGLRCIQLQARRERGSNYVDFTGVIVNDSECDYVDLDVALRFRDKMDRTRHVELLDIQRLPKGVKHSFSQEIRHSKIHFPHDLDFFYISDRDALRRRISLPQPIDKAAEDVETQNSSSPASAD